LVVSYWLLVIGYWLVVAPPLKGGLGGWLVVVGCWLRWW